MFRDTMAHSVLMEASALWPVIGLLIVIYLLRAPTPVLKGIPTVKYYPYLPNFFNRIVYYPKAASMISSGYYKYKDRPFRMLTADGEVYVLPVKYQKELRQFPISKVSSLHAQYENALGKYTNIIVDTELPSRTVRKRLTPNLSRVVPQIIDELQGAFNDVLAGSENDWVKVNPSDMFHHLIALATSRVMVGNILRQNEAWLKAVSTYAHEVGVTLLLLRPVPNYLRPLVAPFLPSVWHMKQSLCLAKRLFVPIINERRRVEKANDPAYTKPDDFLQWMMDLGEEEGESLTPDLIAHHMFLLVGLAVTHTSTMALCHALYDLISMPEYLEPLREEVARTLPHGWYKGTQAALAEQVRLDSFFRESQRFGPPGELSYHRITMQTVPLHDGLILPKGIHVCLAAGPISKDPSFVSSPMTFDGFRWCRKLEDRYALTSELASSALSNGDSLDHDEYYFNAPASFVTVTSTNMGFGYGRQACPGRFFAANTMKAIFSRLILDYEFKFVEGKDGKRPANLLVGEHILPSMTSEVLFRKRPMGF